MSRGTPEQVLQSIVEGNQPRGISTRSCSVYEPEAAFAAQPGSLARGLPGVRESLGAFVAMNGTLLRLVPNMGALRLGREP